MTDSFPDHTVLYPKPFDDAEPLITRRILAVVPHRYVAASSLVIEQFQYAFTQGSLGRFPLYVANHVSLPILETAAYLSRASVVRHCKGRMRGQCSQSTAGISLSKCQGAVPLP